MQDIYYKCEKIVKYDWKELKIKGVKQNESEEDDAEDGLDSNDKVIIKLMKLEEELQDLNVNQIRREGFKYYISAVVSVLFMLIFYFALIPVLSYLFLSTKDSS